MRAIDMLWSRRRRPRKADLPPDFDEEEYLRVNPDVAYSVQSRLLRSGADHWLRFGAREGRRLSAKDGRTLPPDFDEQGYLAANPDVRVAIQGGFFPDGAGHWLALGYKEGRNCKASAIDVVDDRSSIDQDWDTFLAQNEDTTPEWSARHDASGLDGFDASAYVANNADVARTVGPLPAQLLRHWREHGFVEGRIPYGYRPYASRGFGPRYWQKDNTISFFGFLDAQTGLGTSARNYLSAIKRCGIPIIEYNVLDRLGRFDVPDWNPSKARSKINIFHLNADMTHRFFLDGRSDLLDDSYNIGIWFWELLDFRSDWASVFGAFDEIWVGSDFVQRSVASVSRTPVVNIPMVVAKESGDPAEKLPRAYFRIPDHVFAFACIFDVGSVMERKNPFAVLKAFKQAFGDRDDVWLLMKYHGTRHHPEGLTEMRRLAGSSSNVRFYGRDFSDLEIQSFKAAIDCLVSAHRSEGFGLNIAEAMLAGTPVIATGYSGNMEFMTEENSHLIAYALREIGQNYGPYLAQAIWAEPDVDHLAAQMRSVLEDRETTAKKAETARHDIAARHNVEVVAGAVRERFEELELFAPMPRFMETWGRGLAGTIEFRHAAGPRISIIVPVYNIEGRLLHRCVRSVLQQSYALWELVLHDDGSTRPETLWYLEKIRGSDSRIKVSIGNSNQGIAEASNEALAFTSGEFIALLDNDDELAPDALSEMVGAILSNPRADLLYSDEDKIRANGEFGDHYFKPDWSPEHLESVMYLLHFLVIRRSLLLKIGGFRSQFSAAQDYDLALRASRAAREVVHVPRVLYHWRMIEGSAAAKLDAKPIGLVRAAAALQDHLDAQGRDARVAPGLAVGLFRVDERVPPAATVTLLIFTDNRRADVPGRGDINLLDNFLASIAKTTKTDISCKTLVIDNGNLSGAQKRSIEKAGGRVVSYTGSMKPFNFSDKANFGLSLVDTEFVVMLNDDMEVVSPDWIDALVSIAQRPKVGVVGARLLFADDRIQHCGVVLGVNNGCAHVYHGYGAQNIGYNGFTHLVRNYLAVTGACAAFRTSLFDEIGGFDPAFRVDYNDIDFCLRAYEAGYRNVYTPFATLYHFEGTTAGRTAPLESERASFAHKWRKYMERDPYFNPNLSRVSVVYEALPHFNYR